jgi:hypothetical protein
VVAEKDEQAMEKFSAWGMTYAQGHKRENMKGYKQAKSTKGTTGMFKCLKR